MADCIYIHYLGSHLGRLLEFLEMPKDDKVSSVRFCMLMVSTFKKHQNIFYAIQKQVQLRICRTKSTEHVITEIIKKKKNRNYYAYIALSLALWKHNIA